MSAAPNNRETAPASEPEKASVDLAPAKEVTPEVATLQEATAAVNLQPKPGVTPVYTVNGVKVDANGVSKR